MFNDGRIVVLINTFEKYIITASKVLPYCFPAYQKKRQIIYLFLSLAYVGRHGERWIAFIRTKIKKNFVLTEEILKVQEKTVKYKNIDRKDREITYKFTMM